MDDAKRGLLENAIALVQINGICGFFAGAIASPVGNSHLFGLQGVWADSDVFASSILHLLWKEENKRLRLK